MKKSFFLIFILLAVTSQAQVITWSIKPDTYDKIEPCYGDLYYVYKANNIGVVNGDGSIVVTPEANRITGFYGGLALVLKSDSGQERILGILSTNGSYIKVDGIYYTIPYQEFFSEGLLTVVCQNNQTAYMNDKGVIVKSFDVSFISPFSEGYAVVGEEDEFAIIDKRFNSQTIMLGTVAQVYGGSNVYKGYAVIWDSNGKFYNFDVKRGTCKKISEPKSLDYDYLYCFSSITSRPENVPYEQATRSSVTLPVTKQGEKYGYINGEKLILPYQFDQAESFHGTYAIVKANGQQAILALHGTNDTFAAKAIAPDVKYKKSNSRNLTHKFGISIPDEWNANLVNVKLKNDEGSPVNITKEGVAYKFLANGAEGVKKYEVEIDAEGLKLWRGEIAYNYIIESEPVIIVEQGNFKPLQVSVKATNTQADKNDHCYIKATVINPNPDPITATVTIKGSNLLEAVSERVTIPANGSKDISTYFTVRKAVSGQTVTVTTSAGGSATLDGLQLIPF